MFFTYFFSFFICFPFFFPVPDYPGIWVLESLLLFSVSLNLSFIPFLFLLGEFTSLSFHCIPLFSSCNHPTIYLIHCVQFCIFLLTISPWFVLQSLPLSLGRYFLCSLIKLVFPNHSALRCIFSVCCPSLSYCTPWMSS